MDTPKLPLLDPEKINFFGLLPYQKTLARLQHCLMRHQGSTVSLVLDVLDSSAGEWGETYFWVSDNQTTWDIAPEDMDLMDVCIENFHRWSLERNQENIRQGVVKEDGMLINPFVPAHVLEDIRAINMGDRLYESPFRHLSAALGLIDRLGWAYIHIPDWEFNAAIFVVSDAYRKPYWEIVNRTLKENLEISLIG